MISKLKNYIKKQDFNPGFLGLLINPYYFARVGLHKHIKLFSSYITGKVLDAGCGRKPYRNLFETEQYIGMDIENPGHDHTNEDIDVFYDGVTFPFEAHEFDNVICNQVLEHVFEPGNFLDEINRVLKDKGYFLLTVPFAWDEHEQPYDFARYSSFGLRHLLQKHGFEVVEQVKSIKDVRVIYQLFNAYLFKKTSTKSYILNLLITLVLMAPVNIFGQLLSFVLPKNEDLYLDNIILARKVANKPKV